MNLTSIKLIFSIFGPDLDVEQFSLLVGLKPSASWMVGDIVRNSPSQHRKETCWEYSIGFIDTLYVSDLTKNFIEIFGEKEAIISNYSNSKSLKCKVDFIVKVSKGQFPSIYFDLAFLSALNRINSEIDIDIY